MPVPVTADGGSEIIEEMDDDIDVEMPDEDPIHSAFQSMQEILQQLGTTTELPEGVLLFRWQEFMLPLKEAERTMYEQYFKIHLETELGRINRTSRGIRSPKTLPIVTFTSTYLRHRPGQTRSRGG